MDINFIYGLSNGNGSVVVQLYKEKYPRWQPNRQTFIRVHQNLVEYGSSELHMKVLNKWRNWRPWTTIFEEGLLHAITQNHGTSVRALAVALKRSRTIVHRLLQGEALYPFHVHRGQLLQQDGHPWCVTFAQWFFSQNASDMHFVNSCCTATKPPFKMKGCLICTTSTCGP